MLEGGADIRYVQAMLGHAELSTTQIYAQVSIRALQAVHAATHPGSTAPMPSSRHRDDDEPERSSPRCRPHHESCLLLLLTKKTRKRTAPVPDQTATLHEHLIDFFGPVVE